MKSIWMLAAVASLAACAGRGEDDMGAAPDRGDTTAVTTGADTTQWDTTGATGEVAQPTEPGVTPDTGAAIDTATTEQYPTTPSEDTTTSVLPSDTTSMGGYDTTAVPGADTSTTGVTPSDPGMSADTSGVSDMSADSAFVDPTAPADSTNQ